jgi:hypothetical protein
MLSSDLMYKHLSQDQHLKIPASLRGRQNLQIEFKNVLIFALFD